MSGRYEEIGTPYRKCTSPSVSNGTPHVHKNKAAARAAGSRAVDAFSADIERGHLRYHGLMRAVVCADWLT
jgi:hypothetical protein